MLLAWGVIGSGRLGAQTSLLEPLLESSTWSSSSRVGNLWSYGHPPRGRNSICKLSGHGHYPPASVLLPTSIYACSCTFLEGAPLSLIFSFCPFLIFVSFLWSLHWYLVWTHLLLARHPSFCALHLWVAICLYFVSSHLFTQFDLIWRLPQIQHSFTLVSHSPTRGLLCPKSISLQIPPFLRLPLPYLLM